MTVPYSLLMIKPMSVGRGDAPFILEDLLENCPISLRLFRQFVVCDNTLMLLTKPVGPHHSTLDYEQEKIHPPRHIPSWICLFTHLDRQTNPRPMLDDYCGPLDRGAQLRSHLRSRYQKSPFLADDVVHLTASARAKHEATLLFHDFHDDNL
jgi:hypothetical protein